MGTELIKLTDYAVIQIDGEELRRLIADNLGGEEMRPLDWPRIRIPAAGGKQWLVPAADGEAEVARTIQGVILFARARRVYWSRSLEDGSGGAPPDCVSHDSLHGQGSPGGDCAACGNAEFGTSRGGEGRGKACKEFRELYLLRRESIIPEIVVLPPSSLKPWRSYLAALTRSAVALSACVTELGLVEASSKDGVKYSSVSCRLVARLEAGDSIRMREYAQEWARSAAVTSVRAEDVG